MKDYFTKVFFKPTWSVWNCKNCSKPITFSAQRRLLLAVIMGIIFFAFAIALRNIEMDSFAWIIYTFVALAAIFFVFTFDTFRKADSHQDREFS